MQPPSTAQTQARDLATTAARLDKLDQDSPSVLSARLEYVDSLTNDEAGAAPCAQRLDAAQRQLDRVSASRAAQVMFPEGWARVSDAQYRVHSERASCLADPQLREPQLTSALEAAQRAVEQYRAAFDYKSMVVMQFNVALTLRALGSDAAAIAALESALAMDREYGFRDDAEENYRMLRDWKHEPAEPEQITAWLNDFPTRSITLRFAWAPQDETVSASDTRAWLVGHRILHSRGTATARRYIKATPGGWSVSYESAADLDPGVWPVEPDNRKDFFTPALLELPGLDIDAEGNLKAVINPATFAAQFSAATERALRARASTGAGARQWLTDTVNVMKVLFAPGVMESKATEAYRLETAMWIGATLKQGVWYELTAPLSVPGLQRVVVNHTLQFAYARPAPCVDGSDACAEIIVRATPEPDALAEALQDVGLSREEGFDYISSTYLRVVVDPRTLLPQVRETRQYWYVVRPGGEIRLESERALSSTSYP